jgi:hypothetical protein
MYPVVTQRRAPAHVELAVAPDRQAAFNIEWLTDGKDSLRPTTTP